MNIEVIKGGLLTTVQDLGRPGWQAFGVPVGGAMDSTAMKLANLAVGNDESEAVLEMTMFGAELQFHSEACLAFFGADMKAELNGQPLWQGKAISVKKGDSLSFKRAEDGMYTYLSIRGGLMLPTVLGSRSTLLSAQFGGLDGRALKEADALFLNTINHHSGGGWGISSSLRRYFHDSSPIRYVRGRQHEWFTQEAISVFQSSQYTVTAESNRMGYRLSGPPLTLNTDPQLATEGTLFGSIQVPPNGQPIVLMADRQPTGGYPKIGEVIGVDLPRLSQKMPGERLRFVEVSLETAQQLMKDEKRKWNALQAAISLKSGKERSSIQ